MTAITRTVVLYVIYFTTLCYCGIEHIDLNYTADKATFDELFMDGRRAYDAGKFKDAVTYFERAVSDYRMETDVKAQCWLKCSDTLKKTQRIYDEMLDGQLNFLHYNVKINTCYNLCKEKFLGRRGRVAGEMVERFESKEPYSFLQHAYFKLGQFTKSLEAAYTYYTENGDNTLMQEHIDVLVTRLGKTKGELRSREELPHLTLYREGENAYNTKDYEKCVSVFEESLTLFFKELNKCYAACEEQHTKRQASYAASLFKHYSAILRCRENCNWKLTNLDERTSVKYFVPFYYHYLQFCYYQEGDTVEAAIAAETFNYMIPDDPTMAQNLHFYKSQPSIEKLNIQPRTRAKLYMKQVKVTSSLQKIVKGYIEEVVDNKAEDADISEEDQEMLENIYNLVSEDLEADKKIRGDNKKKRPIYSVKKSYRNPNRWKSHPDVKHAKLLMEEESLNGTDRVAFDDVITEKECEQIMQLVKKLTSDDDYNNRLIETRIQQIKELSTNQTLISNLAQSGDGYQHSHDDAEHPFTEKERFEGLTVRSAVEASKEGRAGINETELYLNLSDRARLLTQEYFDLPKRLNFAFTHLVCRHALADALPSESTEHLSHPIHSDNCLVNADGLGTCPKRSPAYTWRDYSALLYLNSDFVGGDFIFADYKNEIQARVKPKCGRMVAFRSNGIHNLHGVLGLRKGTRCALPIWFTLSENRKELEMDRYIAERDLIQMKKKKDEKKEGVKEEEKQEL